MRHDYVRYRIITKRGGIRCTEDFGHLLRGEDGKSLFYIFIVDVDQNEYYNRNRNSMAEYSFGMLKMDIVFLRCREHNTKTGALMTCIVDGVQGMGLAPLREGVESRGAASVPEGHRL